jgi:hypothetical protein
MTPYLGSKSLDFWLAINYLGIPHLSKLLSIHPQEIFSFGLGCKQDLEGWA